MRKLLTILLLFAVPCFGQRTLMNGWTNCHPSDADASAYASAVDIRFNAVTCNALNTLVTSLKSNGLWTKRKAIYILIWGSAATCKYNLKDPRDLDAAFRLTFTGGFGFLITGTHSITNGYADTHLNATSDLTQYNTSLGFFARTNVSEAGFEMGASTTGAAGDVNNPLLAIRIRYNGDDKARSYAYGGYSATDGALGAVDTDDRGVTEGVRVSTTDNRIYKNGTQTGSTNTATATTSTPNRNIYLFAINQNGTAASFDAKECIAAWIGDGINSTEAANENTIWQTFKTSMGL